MVAPTPPSFDVPVGTPVSTEAFAERLAEGIRTFALLIDINWLQSILERRGREWVEEVIADMHEAGQA